MPAKRTPPTITIDSVYTAIETFKITNNDDPDKLNLDDVMLAIMNTPRPKALEDITALCKLIAQLSELCDAEVDASAWKTLVLATLRRRNHTKAPEAKAEAAENEKSVAEGDGERLVYYVCVMMMMRLGRAGCASAAKASACLCRLSIAAGGMRDLCALIEYATFEALSLEGFTAMRAREGHARALAAATVSFIAGDFDATVYADLADLVESAAQTLDADLALVRNPSDGTLPSTINTFLPHNDRGSSKATGHRKLVSCIAELLVWSRTRASGDGSLAAAVGKLKALSATSDAASVESCLHAVQTSVRRLRKELNSAARSSGFALSNQFLLDPKAISLSLLRRGKAGDLANLQSLARKRPSTSSTRILQLLAKRNVDESKANSAESIAALKRAWIPLPEEGEVVVDELRALDVALLEATVRATVAALRKRVVPGARPLVISSMDSSELNDAAAVLVAAALNAGLEWTNPSAEVRGGKRLKADSAADPAAAVDVSDAAAASAAEVAAPARLFLRGEECKVSSGAGVMKLLNTIFTTPRSGRPLALASDAEAASAKEVQNLIDRHLSPGASLLLFAATDVKLPEQVLTKLQLDGSSVHCHIGDEVLLRLQREGARVGDVTISLIWSSYDDLDLHVITPAGHEISYQSRHADGGELDVDMNAGGASSNEPVENVFFGDAERGIEAAKGTYKVVVQNYAYHSKSLEEESANRKDKAPVPFKIAVRMNDHVVEYAGECRGDGKSSNVAVCAFDYRGRVAPRPAAAASAFGTSNLVALTTSVGYSIDAVSQLVRVGADTDALDRVRELTTEVEEQVESAEESTAMPVAAAAAMDTEMMDTEEASPQATIRAPKAERGAFDVTSRERLYLQLSRLPRRFHREVDAAFGGGSLLEAAAATIARRMDEDGVNISELRKAKYPTELVELVKRLMGEHKKVV